DQGVADFPGESLRHKLVLPPPRVLVARAAPVERGDRSDGRFHAPPESFFRRVARARSRRARSLAVRLAIPDCAILSSNVSISAMASSIAVLAFGSATSGSTRSPGFRDLRRNVGSVNAPCS